jgi:2-haloacid dehalogenase
MQAFADVQARVFDVFGTIVDWRSGMARDSKAVSCLRSYPE